MFEKIKKNKIAVVLVLIVLFGGLYFVFNNSNLLNNSTTTETEVPTVTLEPEMSVQPGSDPLNATYNIEGENITLVDGISEEQIPNSSTKIVTQVWGTHVTTDLTGNEVQNPALILTQDPGGSGTFYYVAAAVREDDGYYGTNGIFLGDRIAPKTQEILEDGTIVVNYVDRADDASMSDEPTEAMSRYFRVEGRELVEVENPNL